ncbi:SpoIID/LytB domain-containing protein [Neobacillus vireti]|uniref:SpoIID/LytB domain-containing protein n=1 Tax=Neobacillus vireti TaxID=220686 RepID=UPI002FFE7599
MRRLLPILMTILLLTGLIPAKMEAAENSTEPIVTVNLMRDLEKVTSVNLTVTGSYVVDGTSKLLIKDKNYMVKLENSAVSLYDGATLIKSGTQIKITPINEADKASINGHSYFGSFIFKKDADGYLRPTNLVGMENYLKSVVPSEVYAQDWEMDTLKAQAVAARTYAYFQMIKGSPLTDTTGSQVYKGAENWNDRTNEAVDATAGEMVTYYGKPIEAVFSASNGGMTESSQNETGYAHDYLQVQKDTFDIYTNWAVTIDKQQIDTTGLDLSKPDQWWNQTVEKDRTEEPDKDKQTFTDRIKTALQKNGYENKSIKIVSIPKLKFTEQTSSGRAVKGVLTVQFFVEDEFEGGKLKLQTFDFTTLPKFTATKLRTLIGLDKVCSTLITDQTETGGQYLLKGNGNGHGMGLSQQGANNRAVYNQTYKQILMFYYSTLSTNQVQLTKLYGSQQQNTGLTTIKVQLNGKDFGAGYYGNGTTYVNWRVLDSFKIRYQFNLSDGIQFDIDGRAVKGTKINGELYVKWTDISPGKVTYKSIPGGFNFIYAVPTNIQLNGKNFTTGYYKDGVTYIHFRALDTFKIPYSYKGSGKFIIEGRSVKSETINGGIYLKWTDISPGKITYKPIPGGFNFIYAYPIKVQLNGKDFTAGFLKQGYAYVHWSALKTFNIPYTFKGGTQFEIGGRTVMGETIVGGIYIRWDQLAPGKVNYIKIPGGYNFIYNP